MIRASPNGAIRATTARRQDLDGTTGREDFLRGTPARVTHRYKDIGTALEDASMARIKQLDHNDDAAPQVAHEKEQGPNHRSEVYRTAFPFRVQDAERWVQSCRRDPRELAAH
jgi:hypothetical protein